MYIGGANAVWKVDKRGSLVWAHEIWGAGSDLQGFRHGLHVDARESIYLTGAFYGSVTIGDVILTNGWPQMFLARFDRDGHVIWAKQSGRQQVEYGQDIATDAAGNIYVTGLSMGEELPNTNSYDCEYYFLNKYDEDGNLLWHRRAMSCTIRHAACRLAVDPRGNSFISATFNSVYLFGATNATSWSLISQPFLAKYDTQGNVAWVKYVGSTNSGGGGEIVDVGSDVHGNVHLCGWHDGIFSLGDTNLITTTNVRAFFAKYDADGDFLHAVQSSGNGEAYAYSIAIDATGSVYMAGRFADVLAFADTNLTHDGAAYFAKFDASGKTIWVHRSTNSPIFTALAVDSARNIYAAGFFYGLDGYAAKFRATAPPLSFSRGASSLFLSWSALADGFALETTDQNATEAAWTPVPTNLVLTTTTLNSMTAPLSSARQFFRLYRAP